MSRCVRGIDDRGLHVTNLAAMRDALRAGRPARLHLPHGRLPGAGLRLRAARGDQRRRHVRRDRRRLDPRQGLARSLHEARRELHPHWDFASHVGYSTPEHRAAIEAHGVSAAAPAELPERGLPAARDLTARGSERALEVLEADEPAARVEDDADGVEAQALGERRGRAPRRDSRGHPPHARLLGRAQRVPRRPRPRRVLTSTNTSVPRRSRSGRARRSGCGGCGPRSRSRAVPCAPRRRPRRRGRGGV